MAFTTNYSELVARLQSHMEDDNADFVAELPAIINRAELRIVRDLNLEIFKETEATTIAANGTMATPTDSVRVEWLRTASGRTLQRRSHDYVVEFGGTGAPLYFCEEQDGDVVRVAPAPTSSTNAETRFIKRPAALSADNLTNWITDHTADLLHFAALVECVHYLIEPERVTEFEAAYQSRLVVVRRELRGLEAADYGEVERTPQSVA